MEVMVAMGIAAILTYAISQMLVNSGKQATSIASKGDFNSFTNQLQGAFNNTATCLAAITPPGVNGKLALPKDNPPASKNYPMPATITIGGNSYATSSTFGSTPTSKKALTIKTLEFSGITSAGTSNPNQYVVPLNLVVDRSINGVNAVGGNTLTKSFSLIVTLSPTANPNTTPATYNVIGCAGQYADYWVSTNENDILYSGGSVGIGICNGSPCVDPPAPGATLDVVGAVQANTFMYRSDERMKENVRDIPGALGRVMKLHGVLFDWKDKTDRASSQNQLGFLAQEVETVFPEAVSTNPANGLKTVGYGNLLAPLIEAFKEQKEIIARQQREIEELKKAVAQRKGNGT